MASRVRFAGLDDLIAMKRAAGSAEGPDRTGDPGRPARGDRSAADSEATRPAVTAALHETGEPMTDTERWLETAGVRDLTDGVRILRHVRVPTRDGTRLAADVYLPAADNAKPGRGPRSSSTSRTARTTASARRSGSSGCLVPATRSSQLDVRGSGGSEGVSTDEYLPEEQTDGYDAVEWLARQPWCDGQVNFWGSSYSGFTGLQVAKPPAAQPAQRRDDVLHRRSLLRRLPLPRRAAGHVLRRGLLRDVDGRDERAAARPRPRRRLGTDLGAAPRGRPAVPAHLARAPGRRPVLARRVADGPRRQDHCPGVHDRRLARRLPEPAASPLRAVARTQAPAHRAVEPLRAGPRHARAAHRPRARGRPLVRPLEPRPPRGA